MSTKLSPSTLIIMVVLYALLALYLLAHGRWLDAALWLIIGSGLTFSITDTPEAWHTRPRWMRWAAIGCTVAGLVLFGIQIVLDWRS
jgi:hypothetical protein